MHHIGPNWIRLVKIGSDRIKQDLMELDGSRSSQIRLVQNGSDWIRSDQIGSDQIESDQFRSSQITLHQSGSDWNRFD